MAAIVSSRDVELAGHDWVAAARDTSLARRTYNREGIGRGEHVIQDVGYECRASTERTMREVIGRERSAESSRNFPPPRPPPPHPNSLFAAALVDRKQREISP